MKKKKTASKLQGVETFQGVTRKIKTITLMCNLIGLVVEKLNINSQHIL